MKRQTISVNVKFGFSGILVLVLLGAVLLPMAGCRQVQATEAPVDEEIYLTPYEPGSLIYHVDRYVEEELNLAKQIAEESFEETLQNTIDWNSNYYKLVISDAEPAPALPSSLKMIVYSRRYAKLIEHGKNGLTDKEKSGLTSRLSSDLARWEKLWSDGQSLRASSNILHSPHQSSDEFIVPLTFRINATVLLAGALSVEEALPYIIQCVETLGEETNWSAVGYACDKILGSLDTKTLNPEQQGIVEGYYAWKDGQDAKAFDYETQEFPSFKSPTRPFERATALGANSNVIQDKVRIEMPTQYPYFVASPPEAGYIDIRGYFSDISYSDIQKKVVSFAKSYCETLESTDIMEFAVSFVESNVYAQQDDSSKATERTPVRMLSLGNQREQAIQDYEKVYETYLTWCGLPVEQRQVIGQGSTRNQIIQEYQLLIERYPQTEVAGMAQLDVLRLYVGSDDMSSAESYYTKLVRSLSCTEYEMDAHLLMGLHWLQRKKSPDRAIKYFQAIPDPRSQSYSIVVPGGVLPSKPGELRYEEVLFERAHIQILRCYLKQGRLEDAKQKQEDFINAYPEMGDQARKSMREILAEELNVSADGQRGALGNRERSPIH